jgi:hypothetical protein
MKNSLNLNIQIIKSFHTSKIIGEIFVGKQTATGFISDD